VDNPRAEKVAVVTEVRERLSTADAALLTEYRGLSVAAMATLRRALREAGGEYKIYKNTLVAFAAQDLGLELGEMLTGPTAIAFVDGDAVSVAKALRDFARTNPALVVKGGLLGTDVLDASGARALADVEPREVLLARLAGAFAAPMQQFAGLLQALPRSLAYGLAALIEQRGGVPAEATVTVPAEAADTDAADTDAAVAVAETADTETETETGTAETGTAESTEPENETATEAEKES
jgi:large subunit ribosomal protein L10